MKTVICLQCRKVLKPGEYEYCYVCKKARIRNTPNATAAELNTTLVPERQIKPH